MLPTLNLKYNADIKLKYDYTFLKGWSSGHERGFVYCKIGSWPGLTLDTVFIV